jgi:hypothetical protein
MQAIRKIFRNFIFILILGGLAWGAVANYSFLFSKKIAGVLVSVERIDLNVSLLQQNPGSQGVDPKLFSFAVGIQNDAGEILTASAEDRQWAAAVKGKCVEAVYFPYPPWEVMKSGTFFGARLDRMFDCPDKSAKAMGTPVPAQ